MRPVFFQGNKEARIKEVHILKVALPLRKTFRHAIVSRSHSDSIFLKILLEDGTAGYGESLPREYVTGETAASVIGGLKEIVKRKIVGYAPRDHRETASFAKAINIKGGAAKCALELALLDVYGRHFKSPISSIIGGKVSDSVIYSGVIQAASMPKAIKTCLAFKAYGLHFVKVKVGTGDDIGRLRVARSILGRGADIRVDANCAWKADEAIEKIGEMRRFGISAVEQPVGRDDYEGLKRLTASVPEIIIADESLCTVDDAERLARLKACGMFNIRLSKCGGMLNSLKIAEIARKSGIGIQLGCQVGESGLLSAAGWHFASVSKDISFCEGSYGRHLLREDVTEEEMTIRRGGMGRPVSGPGLGVKVLDRVLDRHTISKDTIR